MLKAAKTTLVKLHEINTNIWRGFGKCSLWMIYMRTAVKALVFGQRLFLGLQTAFRSLCSSHLQVQRSLCTGEERNVALYEEWIESLSTHKHCSISTAQDQRYCKLIEQKNLFTVGMSVLTWIKRRNWTELLLGRKEKHMLVIVLRGCFYEKRGCCFINNWHVTPILVGW